LIHFYKRLSNGWREKIDTTAAKGRRITSHLGYIRVTQKKPRITSRK